VSDLAALAAPNYRVHRGPACTIGLAIQTMPDSDAELLRAALDNPHAPSSQIAKALTNLGHSVKPYTVQRHRRNECRCAG
jgi:hypothetical protein